MTPTSATASIAATPHQRTLTTDEVSALRTGEAISFHHRQDGPFIRATLDTIAATRTYTAREQRLFPETRDTGHADRARIIPVTSSIFGYNDEGVTGWTHHDHPDALCVAMINAATHHDLWPTIAALVRPGDRLHLHWIANNSTDLLRQAELVQDYLHLAVIRAGRSMTFAVADEVCDPHFPVRMIRRHG